MKISYGRLPDQLTGPMTASQVHTLRRLAVEAYQEKQFQHGQSLATSTQAASR